MKTKKVLTTILALVVIGGASWYADRYFVKENSSQVVPSATLDKLVDENKTNTSTTEKIIYASSNNDQKEIIQSNVSGEKTTLFTDKDEDLKIKQWGGLANLTGEFLLDVGSGSLQTIKVNDIGKKEIVMEKFGIPSTTLISPDGKQVAYVTFSNAEADYGFGLYEMTKSGENLRKLVHSEQEIKNLAWNQDSSKIVFSGVNKDKTEIKITDISKDQTQSIYETNQAVLGISVSFKNKIIFTIADPKNLSSSDINIMDLDGKNNQKIYSIKDKAALYPFVSSDFTYLAYLAVEAKDNKIDKDAEGVVTLIKIGTDGNKTTGNANRILGWIQ